MYTEINLGENSILLIFEKNPKNRDFVLLICLKKRGLVALSRA